jgi:hypothetical protein
MYRWNGNAWEAKQRIFVAKAVTTASATALTIYPFASEAIKPWIQSLVSNCIAAVATAAGFSYSFTTNGYIKFPSWLGSFIVQWGSATLAYNTPTNIYFPVTFNSACYYANFAANAASNTGTSNYVYSKSASYINLVNGAYGNTCTASWFAVGV